MNIIKDAGIYKWHKQSDFNYYIEMFWHTLQVENFHWKLSFANFAIDNFAKFKFALYFFT